ncbi:MAG: TIGR01777 family oxidoreductase [Myxococcota bacterium]
MSDYVRRTRLEHSAGVVDAWHARPGAFERLLPPWERVEVVCHEAPSDAEPIADGARLTLQMGLGPLRFRWVARHEGRAPGRGFRDVQEKGPFAEWVHEHHFLPDGNGSSTLEDDVHYRLPLGAVGRTTMGGAVADRLNRTFRYRHRRTQVDLDRHAEAEGQGPWRVAVTGASGMVGEALCAFLTAGGHRVDRLVRGDPEPGTTDIHWLPSGGEVDASALEGVDAVVHLAGEPIFGRWTEEKKRRIMESRREGTRLLAEALAKLERKPRVLVSASGADYYGDRPDEVVDEDSPPGEGFLAEVCRAWEAGTTPAAEAGVRVVNLRIGMVVTARGGALTQMLTPFRLGLGGRMGSGRQGMPWIALDDLIGVIHRAIRDDGLSGPVNAVSPEPVTNAHFTRTLARVLHRPAFLPVPGAAVRLALGEMGQHLLLDGARILPKRLLERGHRWAFRDLEDALSFELGR